MTGQDFSITIDVAASPDAAYAAILDPRGWWGKTIEGDPAIAGGEWTYRYQDLHFSRQRNADLVPGRRVAWQVIDSDLSFLRDRSEWNGTTIMFDLAPTDQGCRLHFTHAGLVPDVECYGACTNAWGGLIRSSLRRYIETGTGDPDNLATPD